MVSNETASPLALAMTPLTSVATAVLLPEGLFLRAASRARRQGCCAPQMWTQTAYSCPGPAPRVSYGSLVQVATWCVQEIVTCKHGHSGAQDSTSPSWVS